MWHRLNNSSVLVVWGSLKEGKMIEVSVCAMRHLTKGWLCLVSMSLNDGNILSHALYVHTARIVREACRDDKVCVVTVRLLKEVFNKRITGVVRLASFRPFRRILGIHIEKTLFSWCRESFVVHQTSKPLQNLPYFKRVRTPQSNSSASYGAHSVKNVPAKSKRQNRSLKKQRLSRPTHSEPSP